MKKEKILTICTISLFIIAVAFMIVTICTRFENKLYLLLLLLLLLLFILIGNILIFVKSSLQKKNQK